MSEDYFFINFGLPYLFIFIDRYVNNVLDSTINHKKNKLINQNLTQIKEITREKISRKFIQLFQKYQDLEDNEIREKIANFNYDFKSYFEQKTSINPSDFNIVQKFLDKNFSTDFDKDFIVEFQSLFKESIDDYFNEIINFLEENNLDSSHIKLDLILEYSKSINEHNPEIFTAFRQLIENQSRIIEYFEQLELNSNPIQNIINEHPSSQYQLGNNLPALRCRSVVGRNDMVQIITNYFSKDNTLPIVTIHGGPGYGKTELAILVSKSCLEKKII